MADVIRGKFGAQRNRKSGWRKYEAQEAGEPPDSPDIERPPDQDLPDPDEERGDIPNSPGAPPFTGEDVEDVGPPLKRDRPTPI
jgi:hypothetical protein